MSMNEIRRRLTALEGHFGPGQGKALFVVEGRGEDARILRQEGETEESLAARQAEYELAESQDWPRLVIHHMTEEEEIGEVKAKKAGELAL